MDDFRTLLDVATDASDFKLPEKPTITVNEDDVPAVPAPTTGDYLEPWLQQPGETVRAYELFCMYRDMGPKRSFKALVEVTGLSVTRLHANSSDGSWADRVKAWDSFQDRVYQATLLEKIRAMAEGHAETAAKNIAALLIPAEAVLRKLENNPDLIEDLSEKEMKQLLQMTINSARVLPSLMSVERLSRGLPTEITHRREEVEHIVRVPDAEHLAQIVSGLIQSGGLAGLINDGNGTDDFGEIVDAEIEPVHSGDPDS